MSGVILALLLIGPILLLALSVYALARKAAQNATEAREMGLLASHLEGQLKQSEDKAEKLVEIAKHAIDEAAKVAQLKPDEIWQDAPKAKVKPPVYVAPVVAFCSRCNVSVRHDPSDYPVKCPSCANLIDPTFDNPPEF